MDIKSKVYILVEGGKVMRCDGGYTIANVDPNTWVLIDEGMGDKYNLCQSHYFEKPIFNMDGSHNYRYEKGVIREATEEEKAEEIAAVKQNHQQTTEEQLADLAEYVQVFTEMLLGGAE